MLKTAYAVIRTWTINETTASNNIRVRHRSKRLIEIILASNEWLNLNVGIGSGITNLQPRVHEPAQLFIISCQFLKRYNTVAQIIGQRRFRMIRQKFRFDDLTELG